MTPQFLSHPLEGLLAAIEQEMLMSMEEEHGN